MDNEAKGTFLEMIFDNGVSVYFVSMLVSFLLDRVLESAWVHFAPAIVLTLYFIWAFVSIYSSKYKSLFDLDKKELLFYQVIFPTGLSVLIGVICASVTGDSQMSFIDNTVVWISNKENLSFLIVVFSISVLLCYFAAFERVKIGDATKVEDPLSDESIELCHTNTGKLDGISENLGNIQSILEKKSQVGYTATCIPIKYNKEHETFMFVLIRNLSHEVSQWMFPGSHVEVSNNKLRNEFDLTDVEIVPSKVVEEKVKKEAGLKDLQFLDPYYEVASLENTENGKEQRSYPNTCYPAKAPVFNYLFRVNESARCYKEQNHRCHYDFTYIAEYDEIDEKEAQYEVVEIEFNRNKNFKSMERTEAIAHITSKLGNQINKKINAGVRKNQKSQFTTPFDKLCLDSIPEMIYNAILFYIDYKDFK